MEQLNDSQWRSTDTNSDNLDESIPETLNSSYLSCNTQKDADDCNSVEDGLLDAMSNLQLESSRTTEIPLPQTIDINSVSEPHLTLPDGDNNNKGTLLDETQEKNTQNSSKQNDNNEKLTTTTKNNSKLPNTGTSKLNNTRSSSLRPSSFHKTSNTTLNKSSIRHTSFKEPDKHSTPALNTSLNKSNVNNSSFKVPQVPVRQSLNTSLNKSSAKHTSLTGRIIKTIVDTADGMQVKEEKIGNFSIPIVFRKKRTEPVPFSFSCRNNNKTAKKNTQEEGRATVNNNLNKSQVNNDLNKSHVPMIRSRSASSVGKTSLSLSSKPLSGNSHPHTAVKPTPSIKRTPATSINNNVKTTNNNNNIDDKSKTKISVPTLRRSKSATVNLSMSSAKSFNQENRTPNISTNSKPITVNKSHPVMPLKSTAVKKATEKQEFDALLKKKDIEVEKARVELEKKQKEKDCLEKFILKKTMECNRKSMLKMPLSISSQKKLPTKL